ncbi:MAG: MFS transporter [Cyanobacteria bacterium P01_D01_bin.36]
MTSLRIKAPSKVRANTTAYVSSAAVAPASRVTEQLATGSRFSKSEIRNSLTASTWDGTFSSAFENVIKGVLISNFLLGLGADAFEVGLLTSIPMLAHLLQPVGAYFSEKTTSRHRYCLWIYGAARLIWLLPAAGTFAYGQGRLDAHGLTLLTMTVLALSNVLDAVGSASWMSWMAVLVPSHVRGRYFSLRRSLSSLTALLTIPIGGWIVSRWMGGEIEGYGIALIIAVVMGLASLGFQFAISDVNPQAEAIAQQLQQNTLRQVSTNSTAGGHKEKQASNPVDTESADVKSGSSQASFLADGNFVRLLLFLGTWTFGLSLCKPFFNFYLLDSLKIDVQWVTLYSGLVYGAFFLMITLWGRLADRVGNRPVLIVNCLLTTLSPLLWLCTDSSDLSIWLLLPLLHLLQGGTFAALELCTANIQLELAPPARQSGYFAIAAATIGIMGALGTTFGGILAELPSVGLTGLFIFSTFVRFASIAPLLWVEESRAVSIRDVLTQQLQRLSVQWQTTRAKA